MAAFGASRLRGKALTAALLWLATLPSAAQQELRDVEGSSIDLVSEPLETWKGEGHAPRPLLVQNLPQYATRCYKVIVPEGVARVKILASAVGLAGNPSVEGGWDPVQPGRHPSTEAGFQTLAVDEDVDGKQPFYYICVRTFSAQGCSLLLTAAALDSKDIVSLPIWLTPSHPTVWPLGKTGKAFGSQQFLVPVGTGKITDGSPDNSMQISVVPVDGEASITVREGARCDGHVLAEKTSAPGVISLSDKELAEVGTFCIEVTGDGTVSLAAAPQALGPLLAPAVPAVGVLKVAGCTPMRLDVHAGTDVVITALAEDGSRLDLSATLRRPDGKDSRWKPEASPDREGAVLEVKGADVDKECRDADPEKGCGLAPFSLRVCRTNSGDASGKTLVFVTALSASSVTPLEDGLPQTTVISDKKATDFRYLVPGGKAQPDFVTISATTLGKALLVADTARFPNDPHAYRWSSSESSTPTIRLTTKLQWKSDEVHLIDCRPPCFVYISSPARSVRHSAQDNELKITAVSERKEAIPLVQDNAVEARLAKEEVQQFSYDILHKDSAALFTLSATEGSVEMQVSGDEAFSQDVSTPWAHDAIILPPGAVAFRHALLVAEKGQSPKLFVRARGTSETPSTFSIVGRMEGDAQVLHNGGDVHGAVVGGTYDRYRFYVGEDQLPHNKKEALNVTIQVSPVMGDPDVFISCHDEHPTEYSNDWGGKHVGQDAFYFTSLSPRFKAGWIYVSVSGGKGRAAYGLRVEWGKAKVNLEDGTEEIGRVMKNDYASYSLVVSERKEDDQPVVIRAQAWVGAFFLCVAELDDEGGAAPPPSVTGQVSCKYEASADSTRQAESGAGLAAIDIPAKDLRKGGRLALLIRGLHATNTFSLRALVDSSVVLTEGHDLVDAFAPACCMAGPAWEQLLSRRYRTFVRPVPGVSIEVHALGDGNLAGATLRARRYHGGSVPGEDVEKDDQEWPWSATKKKHDSHGGVQSALTVNADLSRHRNGVEEHRDFWLEIELSVEYPVNYTMAIKANGVHQVQRAQKQLLPGQRMQTRAMDSEMVQFALDSSAKDGAWLLEVRQCYGRVTVDLPYAPSVPASVNGSDVNLPLPTTGLQRNSGSLNAGGAARLKPLTTPPVIYEMLLKPPGSGPHESPVFFDEWPALKRDLTHPLGFSFVAAQVNETRLHSPGLLAAGDEAALFYMLVAIPSNRTLLNANSTCGLMEAVKRKEAVTVKLTQGSTLGQRRLSAAFPALEMEEYKINVLVTLISQNGKTLAARCYDPIVFDKRTAVQPPPLQNKVLAGLILLAIIAGCSYISSSSKPGSSRRYAGQSQESVEMDEPYELQEDLAGGAASFGSSSMSSSRGRGKQGYVPPEMHSLC